MVNMDYLDSEVYLWLYLLYLLIGNNYLYDPKVIVMAEKESKKKCTNGIDKKQKQMVLAKVKKPEFRLKLEKSLAC